VPVRTSLPAWVAPVHLTSCFWDDGSRGFGADRGSYLHGGVDLGPVFGVDYGDKVYAIHSGIIGWGYEAGGAGVYLTLQHGDGTASTYFHLSKRLVSAGSRVKAGDIIGLIGDTGDATVEHLHFETHRRLWGEKLDPIRFMRDRGVRLSC